MGRSSGRPFSRATCPMSVSRRLYRHQDSMQSLYAEAIRGFVDGTMPLPVYSID
jgi:hypothetical protein